MGVVGRVSTRGARVSARTGGKPSKLWICSTCERSISVAGDARGGYVVIESATGGWPRPDAEGGLRMRVYHAGAPCDLNPEAHSYWMGVERLATLDRYVSWVHHCCDKAWMTPLDAQRMLAFWFDGHRDCVHKHSP